MWNFILLTILLGVQSPAKHKHEDSNKMTIDFSSYSHVHIYNTGGAVDVKGISSGTGEVSIQRRIEARSSSKLENAIQNVYLDTMVIDDELVIFIESPYQELTSRYSDYLRYEGRGRFQHWNSREVGVEYLFDLDIKLPAGISSTISTHKGDINIEGLSEELTVMNHFDDVVLKDVQKVLYAHTHHGDVEVSYSGKLSEDVELDTHHGDIVLKFRQAPSANIEFESYHGSMYTDFDWEPGKLLIEQNDEGRKTRYKVGGKTNVTMGNGGPRISFDSHHGDFYILKS